jgi:hypothetical protein
MVNLKECQNKQLWLLLMYGPSIYVDELNFLSPEYDAGLLITTTV